MSRAELIGREDELTRLHAMLAAARRGAGGTTFVIGEPGIGKTRLAAEAIGAAVDAGMVAVRGRVSAVGPVVPYRALVEALMSLARSELLPTLSKLGSYGGALAQLVPDSVAARDTMPSSPVMVAEAVLRLLAEVGRHRGCLLVLDDLHDADAETLTVAEYLLDNLRTAPVALLLASRSEPCVATDLAVAGRHRGTVEVIELRPLGRDQVRRLTAVRLGLAPHQVPDQVVALLATDGVGIPFVVEELIYELTRSGQLVAGPDGCRLAKNQARPTVPATVARSIARRTDRLGPHGRAVLTTAAVIGKRFPLPILRLATDADERELLATLHAGVAAQLIRPDEPVPDWYAFRHPLTAEALLSDLTPTTVAEHARRAADAIARHYGETASDWCARLAELREQSGERTEAARLFAAAGRRALAEGAVQSAVALLRRADRLLEPDGDPGDHANVLESLLHAIAESGRFELVADLSEQLDTLTNRGLPAARRAALHAQLANVANLAGRPAEAVENIDIAQQLLGPDPADADRARVDVIAAYVELSRRRPDRLQLAADLAERAAAAAERAELPIVACDALQLLGYLAKLRDSAAEVAYFEQARQIAQTHRLPIFRVASEVFLARAACVRDGNTADLERARRSALRIGALPLAYEAGGVLALQRVMCCEFAAAERALTEDLADATRLRLGRAIPFLQLTRAVSFAHQGLRQRMEETLATVEDDDAAPYLRPVSYGMARAFCSLLEEDGERARRDLAQALAFDTENPSAVDYGRYGVMLLLGVLDRRSGWQHHRAAAELSVSHARWNAQFVEFAQAVLLGRDGRPDEACVVAERALCAAAIFPTARHLALRLVARSAYEDGWGQPVQWLRQAEDYFHRANLPAVASACRGLLRGMGATVRQRRAGVDELPAGLRAMGVTRREFEVGKLLAERIGNKAIAVRLHISPRTVEKHVASLLLKTGQPDRESFAAAAPQLLSPELTC